MRWQTIKYSNINVRPLDIYYGTYYVVSRGGKTAQAGMCITSKLSTVPVSIFKICSGTYCI